jgi:hypothetical protein
VPYRDVAGRKVWFDPKSNKAQLRLKSGGIFEFNEEGAEKAIASGRYSTVSQEDVATYDRRKNMTTAERVGEKAATLGEAAAAGLVDISTGPFRLGLAASEALMQNAILPAAGATPEQAKEAMAGPRDLRQSLGGRETLRSAAGLIAEARGTAPGEQPELDYERAARERATQNPIEEWVGYTAGQLPVALATPLAKGWGLVAQGAGEGFLYGASGSGENAFLRGEDEVSAEYMLADGLVGSILGGGIGLGLHGIGAGVKGAKSGIGSLFRRGESRALETAGEAAERSSYRTSAASADDMAKVMSRATGEEIEPGLASAIYNEYVAKNLAKGSEMVTGAEGRFIEEAISATPKGSKIRETIANPELYRQQNSQRFTEALSNHLSAFDEITEVSKFRVVKAEAWKRLIDPELDEAARASSYLESKKVLGDLNRMESTKHGPGVSRLADELELEGRNSRVWTAVYSQASAAAAELSEYSLKSGASSESMVALDGLKRMLQKNVLELRTRASKLMDVGQDYVPMVRLADHLEQIQERTRKFLEREDIWGRGGRAQQRINASWTAMLDPENEARMGLRGILQRTGKQYESGRWQYRVNQDRIDDFLGTVGRKSGGQRHLDMVRQLDAERDLVEAIGESVGRSSPEFARFDKADSALRSVMGDTIERSEWLNKSDAVRAAASGGPNLVTSGTLGGIAAGPAGVAVAGLASLVSHPDRMIRMAIGVEAAMKRVDGLMNGHLARMFERAGGKATRLLPEGPESLVGTTQDRAVGGGSRLSKLAVPAATRVFVGRHKGRKEAYKKRSEEVIELADNAEVRHGKLARMGEGGASPGIAIQLALKQSAGLAFLRSKLPLAERMQNSLTPHLDRNEVSDQEIDTFARYWSAVVAPMSVLEDLEKGRATYEQVEALQAVHPMLYWRIRQRMLYMFANAKVLPPYKVRLGADMLLNLDGKAEPSMSPGFLMRQAQRLQELQQRQPPTPPNRGASPNLASRYGSPMDLEI